MIVCLSVLQVKLKNMMRMHCEEEKETRIVRDHTTTLYLEPSLITKPTSVYVYILYRLTSPLSDLQIALEDSHGMRSKRLSKETRRHAAIKGPTS